MDIGLKNREMIDKYMQTETYTELDIICTKIPVVLGGISKILHDSGHNSQLLMLTLVEIK